MTGQALKPFTYLEQATLVGFLALGEDYPFIAEVLGRTVCEVHSAYDDISWTRRLMETLPDTVVIASTAPKKAAQDTPAPSPVAVKPKWQPRRFRVLPTLSRQPKGLRDVTAQLMGDPVAAAFERSLQSPPPFRPDPRYSKRIF